MSIEAQLNDEWTEVYADLCEDEWDEGNAWPDFNDLTPEQQKEARREWEMAISAALSRFAERIDRLLAKPDAP